MTDNAANALQAPATNDHTNEEAESNAPATPEAEAANAANESNAPESEGDAPAAEAPAEADVYFEDLDLSDDVLDALYDMRFEKCTPIQARCIPPILEGRDVLGVAQTGTGKTAAYLLPILTLLGREPHPEDAVNCLVVAPTRELARQIDQALQGFSYYMNINGVAVYGGNDGARYEQERRSLTAGADIVLATPGRLITHLQLGTLDLSRTTHLILDEADRMLDMGFAEDIMQLVKAMPQHRQTILFSATMPPKIAQLARSVMHDPVEVSIAVSKPAKNIDQSIYVCHESDKPIVLRHIFEQQPPERVIVFSSSKQKVKELTIQLARKGHNVRAMHSDLSQPERDEVMQLFRARKVDLLVATDIVARGIDIDDITMVVNYDAPRDAEEYVHRIGRTARAGREGKAVTLVGEKDLFRLASIERLLKMKITRAPLPEGVRKPEAGGNAGARNHNGKHGGSRGRHTSRRGNAGEAAARSENGRKQKHGGARPEGRPQSAPQPAAANGTHRIDARPASRRRPPKSGAGRKPQQ